MNPNIDLLSLSNCGITSASSICFLELLIFKDSKIKDLNLEGNELTTKGAIEIFKAMKINKVLQNINISDNKIDENDEFVNAIIDFVKMRGNPVENLNLSKNNINMLTCTALCKTFCAEPKIEHNFQSITLPDKVDKDIANRINEFMKAKNKKKKGKGGKRKD